MPIPRVVGEPLPDGIGDKPPRTRGRTKVRYVLPDGDPVPCVECAGLITARAPVLHVRTNGNLYFQHQQCPPGATSERTDEQPRCATCDEAVEPGEPVAFAGRDSNNGRKWVHSRCRTPPATAT